MHTAILRKSGSKIQISKVSYRSTLGMKILIIVKCFQITARNANIVMLPGYNTSDKHKSCLAKLHYIFTGRHRLRRICKLSFLKGRPQKTLRHPWSSKLVTGLAICLSAEKSPSKEGFENTVPLHISYKQIPCWRVLLTTHQFKWYCYFDLKRSFLFLGKGCSDCQSIFSNCVHYILVNYA